MRELCKKEHEKIDKLEKDDLSSNKEEKHGHGSPKEGHDAPKEHSPPKL